MSVIGLRDWEIWSNNDYFAVPATLHGQFVLWITPALMVGQTIEFVFEQIEDMRRSRSVALGLAQPYLFPSFWPHPPSADGSFALYKMAPFQTGAAVKPMLDALLNELRTLSLCLDFPLACNRIEYEIPPGQADSGTVLVARRKSMIRALAFEIEERETAGDKLRNRSDDYAFAVGSDALVAAEHYLTGLTLLGLEDRSSGLLDAAFMQFYQGCETLLLRPHHKGKRPDNVDNVKRRIAADSNVPNPREMQIIVAHVWKVRNKFFGHRASSVPSTGSEVYQVAKQVLVVRWLCRRLIDTETGQMKGLCREMRFYQASQSEEFRGTLAEIETAFVIPEATGEPVEVFDARGSGIETYHMR